MLRLPMQQFAGKARVTDKDGKIAGALPRRILLDGNLDATFRDQARKDIRYSARNAGRDVKQDAWLQTFQIPHDQRIGSGHVSYVEEIPLCIKIADANDRRCELSLDAGDLHGKCRNHEGLRLPRTGVIEWAQADALEPRSY